MEDAKMVKIGDINLSDDPAVTLTIRLIMQGKEVGSIIGKKGEIVKRFREESGAKINISDCSCPERIVTVSGSRSAIYKAFTLITKKFEEWCSQFQDNANTQGKPQIPIRLIVPASQCGSLIGKGGSKIKEIREITGCSIQVASEMLPNSTERAVTLSGSAEAITQCIYHICCVMLESPPKGATIPYRPKPQVNGPVIVANGQAYTIQGNYAVPAQEVSGIAKNPLAGLAALGLAGAIPSNTGGLNPTAPVQSQSHEMTVPNDLIGCIIGKGGTKIAEIRQISGAMIRISNCEERDSGNTDRTITITGNPDSVALAQYLINMSVELQKANLGDEAGAAAAAAAAAATAQVAGAQPATAGIVPPSAAATLTAAASAAAAAAANSGVTGAGATGANAAAAAAAVSNPLATAIPLAQLLAKPGTLNALNSLSALGSLTDLLGNLSSGAAAVAPIQTTGVNRPKTTRMRSPNTNNSMNGDSSKKSERNKFNPY
ncbi:poly(rC)-binding protein 3 isoform X4 [Anopheles arabiensis]|uniref:poly(rC)-binding protein 3 isoform X4 n=1 Tax=Anopheles arabiensis TaxID=7173 RepID=UPI001AAD2C3A|nr:poly(rC)-binding protein 3 isoform X4 [Anopheles arabiensis]XP_040227398.1 poly(rC)-binding protein 3 isoform X4 [Anopheles coluzzii]XP_061504847.1 poly(rC)-binding protein 3 isoform X4 [Anopheles gambiae]XP_061504848.1 poly(rC)-binding protein 3 isoform X4 [Anopheles gambiae]XP_061504849.1 poly(rC)-binding protein 3 isoform X4 [Anopheles gambiae]XP_061504850.1 poly(rC)-binding protein 3 isoform X4 [Anopheles gambiae]